MVAVTVVETAVRWVDPGWGDTFWKLSSRVFHRHPVNPKSATM